MRIARLQSFGFGAQLQEQAVKLFRQFLHMHCIALGVSS